MSDEKNIRDLPNGWTYGKLEDLIYIAGRIGWRGLKSDEYTQEGPLLLSVYNLNNGDVVDLSNTYHISEERYNESPEIQIKNDDILLVKDGGIGKIGIVKGLNTKATVNSSLLVIRSGDMFIPKFLFYFLKGPKMQEVIHRKITGSTLPHLFQRDIKQFELLIPPIMEQKRITVKLDELTTKLDSGIESLKKTKILLKKYRQAVLRDAFKGKLTEEWSKNEIRNVESVSKFLEKMNKDKRAIADPIIKTSSNELPNYWIYAKLGYVTNIIMGQSPPGESYNQNGIGVPLINGPVEFGTTPFSKTIKSKFTTRPTRMCKENDLILCVRGSTTGRINIAGFDACIGRGVAAIHSHLSQRFINLYIHSIEKQIYYLGTGSTFPNVTIDSLSKIMVPVPPLNEQEKIVDEIEYRFSIIDKLDANLDERLKQSEVLKQCILHQAFIGHLVPHNPADESAEKLLEHIKAEKAKSIIGSSMKKTVVRKVKCDSNQAVLF